MRLPIILLALSVMVSGCSYEPSKPSNVPAEAVWLGGITGGRFVRCNRTPDNPNAYQCTVYDDFSGEIRREGLFTVENGNQDFNPDDKEIYKYYDGGIVLRDSRRLVQIIPSDKTIK